MDHADKSDSENVVLDEHRLAQVSAAFDEHCRDEVGKKWIREPDAGVSRIFRWEVVAEREARDHAQVKWQVAEVVQQSRAHAGAVFDDRATKHFPKDNGDDGVEQKISDCS